MNATKFFFKTKLFLYSLVFFALCLAIFAGSILYPIVKPVQAIPESQVTSKVLEIENSLKAELAQLSPSENASTETKDSFKLSKVNLFIPKINLNLGVLNGGKEVLEEGIWNHFPERFWADKSNVVLSGHRFTVGLNPAGIERSSPLLHADRLDTGDSIYLISANKTVNYKIQEKFMVKPDSLWIEDNTNKNKMLTLYTCGPEGAEGDRLVFKAVVV